MRIDELPYGFWIANGRPGASEARIRAAETLVGWPLPSELAKALLKQDGGVSVYSGFRRMEYYVPLPPLLSVDEILAAHRSRGQFGTPDGILAIAAGAHEWLGLDYRLGTAPAIVFQETDEHEIEHVANSFDEYLAGLVED